MQHDYPQGKKSGRITPKGEIIWQIADWCPCRCGLFHSNREIPDHYWNQWRNMPPDPVLKDGRPKEMSYTAGVILMRGNQVWVTQSYRNFYGFPKGSFCEGENMIHACLREFKEETGCDLENFTLQDFTKCDQIRWFDVIKRRQYEFLIIKVNQHFDLTNFRPEDDVEITSFGWCNIGSLRFLRFSKSMREICTQFLEFVNSENYDEFLNKRNTRLRERNLEEFEEKIKANANKNRWKKNKKRGFTM